MGRDFGFELFNIRLESSPVDEAYLIKLRVIADVLIATFAIVGLLCCTGAYTLFFKRKGKQLWHHATTMAITTIVFIRFIWLYFSIKFFNLISQVTAVNETNLHTLEKWKSYDHSCSDEYSTFNVPDRIFPS